MSRSILRENIKWRAEKVRGNKEVTVNEVYTAIRRSNEEKCYTIVYLINNSKLPEAVSLIQGCFRCNEKTAAEAAHMIKMDLEKIKSKREV